MPREPFIRRVKLRNFKSIAECDVELGRLTLMVGRNGAGKSNFLDALRFVADALQRPLKFAIRFRGDAGTIQRRCVGCPADVEMSLELQLDERRIEYSFVLGSRSTRDLFVRSESFRAFDVDGEVECFFEVSDGELVRTSAQGSPAITSEGLSLPLMAGMDEFQDAYWALYSITCYNVLPVGLRGIQPVGDASSLRSDGSNAASVLHRMQVEFPERFSRVAEYLRAILPDLVSLNVATLGVPPGAVAEMVEFEQQQSNGSENLRFAAGSMSDGTLRALGILVAALQPQSPVLPVRFVGIEEPETALHPAAAGVLLDALRDASEERQVLVTTHSADLLDRFDPDHDTLLVVVSDQGATEIGPADPASVNVIRKHLYTPGDLLRMDQLGLAPRPATGRDLPVGQPATRP